MRCVSNIVHSADGFIRLIPGLLVDYSVPPAEIPPVWLEPEQLGDDEPLRADSRDG